MGIYIAIAIKKVAPKTTPIDTPRAEAPLKVEVVEAATLAAVVDVSISVEAMVIDNPVGHVDINSLFVSVVGTAPVDVAPVKEAVETVEPETDVEVGPGIPLLVTNGLKISENSHPK